MWRQNKTSNAKTAKTIFFNIKYFKTAMEKRVFHISAYYSGRFLNKYNRTAHITHQCRKTTVL